MASHLDLEEQEQLDQIKAFWARYGDLITWVLIAVFGAVAAWNGWQYWQRSQAAQAAVMYDEVERAARLGDLPKLERALSDMKERFGRTTYASQAVSAAARVFYDAGKAEQAQKELSWVADHGADEAYKAVARLRLAGLYMDAKAYDKAQQILAGDFPREHAAMVADRKGDLLLAQGQRDAAKAEYLKSFQGFDDSVEYRRIVEVKLNTLGADPRADASAKSPAGAASGTKP